MPSISVARHRFARSISGDRRRRPGLTGGTLSRLLLALAATLSLNACAENDGTSAQKLRVADQFERLGSVLSSAGQDKPEAYQIEWSNFIGGPAVIAAETGGSVDVGWMAETPMIFAQAAGSPVKIIAVGRPVGENTGRYALVTASGSSLRTPGDLEGKKVFFLPGTVVQYVLLQVLEQAGLSFDDIKPVTSLSNVGATLGLLESGQIDAAFIADPMFATLEASGKIRVIATSNKPLKSGLGFLVAPQRILDDPAAQPLLRDFVARTASAFQWQIDNPAPAAIALAKNYRLPPHLGPKVLARSLTQWVPVDESIIAEQQAEADAFFRIGLIKKRLDVRSTFDTRFNDVIAQAQLKAEAPK